MAESPTQQSRASPVVQAQTPVIVPAKPVAVATVPAQTQTQAQTQSVAPFQIVPMGNTTRYIKAIIYGPPGVGKTTLALTAYDIPSMRDVLILDADKGTLSVDHYTNTDRIPVTAYSQVARIQEYLRIHCRLRDAGNDEELQKLQDRYLGSGTEESTRLRKYQTLVVDTITEVQSLVMYQLLGVRIGQQKLDAEPDSPEFKQWNQNALMVRGLIRELKDLPMHIIIIAHERIDEDFAKRKFFAPSLPGKLATEVVGYVDVLGRMVAANAEQEAGKPAKPVRRLFLAPRPNYVAKNRFANFKADHLDNPKMADLIAPLLAARTAQKD